MTLDAKTQTCALRNTETSMVIYAPFTVQKTAKMMKYSAPEHETQLTDVIARTNAKLKPNINGEKLQVLIVPDGALPFVMNMKSYALQWSILVMVAQQKKSVGKPSKTRMVSFVQERNSQSKSREKILEKMVRDEVDTFQPLITAQYIAKNG